MLILLFYYIAVPFLLAYLVLRFIRKYGGSPIREDIRLFYAQNPIEKGYFRVFREDDQGRQWLGDFENQVKAVDRAYQGKEQAQRGGQKAAFLVLNDKGEILEETDA
ncbi:MAG: hypothetical protein HY549_08030 [Elusimicrobia bacterium]|nr:hypothetical protein [Elusimicrobiota bacterium]